MFYEMIITRNVVHVFEIDQYVRILLCNKMNMTLISRITEFCNSHPKVDEAHVVRSLGIRKTWVCQHLVFEGKKNEKQCSKVVSEGETRCKEHQKAYKQVPVLERLQSSLCVIRRKVGENYFYVLPDKKFVFDEKKREFIGKINEDDVVIELSDDDKDYLRNHNLHGEMKVRYMNWIE